MRIGLVNVICVADFTKLAEASFEESIAFELCLIIDILHLDKDSVEM